MIQIRPVAPMEFEFKDKLLITALQVPKSHFLPHPEILKPPNPRKSASHHFANPPTGVNRIWLQSQKLDHGVTGPKIPFFTPPRNFEAAKSEEECFAPFFAPRSAPHLAGPQGPQWSACRIESRNRKKKKNADPGTLNFAPAGLGRLGGAKHSSSGFQNLPLL